MKKRPKRDLKYFFQGVFITSTTIFFVWFLFFSNILPTHSHIQTYEEAETSKSAATDVDKGTVFHVKGEKIILDPGIKEGTVGTHNPKLKDTISIKSGMSLEDTKETCEHEMLHEQGADPENHNPGDYVYEMDEHMNSEVCLRFLYELGYTKGLNE